MNSKNLVFVKEPPVFKAKCLYCEQEIRNGKVADLDGEPFKAYYHEQHIFNMTHQEIEENTLRHNPDFYKVKP